MRSISLSGTILGFGTFLLLASTSVLYATTYYADLPVASSGATMRSADWNSLVGYANKAIKQDVETLTATGGKIGIGTSNPQNLLHISSTSNAILRLDSGAGLAGVITSYNASTAGGWIGLFPSSDSRLLNFVWSDLNNNSAPITVMRNGNVGIGTVSPTNAFHIRRDSLADNSSNALLKIDGKFNAANIDQSDIIGISFRGENAGGGAAENLLVGSSWNSATSTMNLLLAPSTGYVGIGTVNPSNPLQIGSMGSSGYGGNQFAFGNGTQVSAFALSPSAVTWYTNTNYAFIPSGAGSTGRVGIGTTGGTAQLNVWWSGQFAGSLKSSDWIGAGCEWDYYCENGGWYAIMYADGHSIATVGWQTASDQRLKHDIQTLSWSLSKVLSLRGVSYKLNSETDGRNHIGVVAQEMETVFPEIVMDGRNGYKSVDYDKLVAPIIEAIKEFYKQFVSKTTLQDREISELKQKNAELESKNTDLEIRLEKLENKLR